MKSPEQLRLSHILVKASPGDPATGREVARKKTEDLKARLDAGEDFASLAGQNSDDPGSKANGGELPWVSRGDTVPAFEQAAFALSPGETSEIVETPFGYHIIKLAERKPSQALPYDDVVGRIEEFLTQQAVQEQIKESSRGSEVRSSGRDFYLVIDEWRGAPPPRLMLRRLRDCAWAQGCVHALGV